MFFLGSKLRSLGVSKMQPMGWIQPAEPHDLAHGAQTIPACHIQYTLAPVQGMEPVWHMLHAVHRAGPGGMLHAAPTMDQPHVPWTGSMRCMQHLHRLQHRTARARPALHTACHMCGPMDWPFALALAGRVHMRVWSSSWTGSTPLIWPSWTHMP